MYPVRLWTRCGPKLTVKKDRGHCWHWRQRREGEKEGNRVVRCVQDTSQTTSDHPPVAGENYVHTCVMVGGERALLAMTVGVGGMLGGSGRWERKGCVWKP